MLQIASRSTGGLDLRLIETGRNRFAPDRLQFSYKHVLDQPITIGFSLPKTLHRRPSVLTKQQVRRLIDAPGNLKHRLLLMTTYAAGLKQAKAHISFTGKAVTANAGMAVVSRAFDAFGIRDQLDALFHSFDGEKKYPTNVFFQRELNPRRIMIDGTQLGPPLWN